MSSARTALRSRRAARRSACVLALWIAWPAAASAGVRMDAVTRRVDTRQGAATENATLRLEGSRLRIDAGDGRGTLIYDADSGTAWLLDHRKQSYVEVDRSQAQALARQAGRLQQEMRQRLEGRLTPEQMKAAEAMMGDYLGQESDVAAGPPVRVRATDTRDRVADVPCRELELLRGEERVAELCAADPAAAGLSPASFAVLQDAAAFLDESVGQLAPGARQAGTDLLRGIRDLDGFPMRARAFEDGALVAESRIEKVQKEPVPASVFAVPDGYRPMFKVQVRGEGGGQAPAGR